MEKLTRGRALAAALVARLEAVAAQVTARLGRAPTLGIVSGSDEAARRFVQIKRDALASISFDIEPIWLSDDADTAAGLSAVEQLNARAEVDAIFLQFPLPSGIEGQLVADAIVIDKDIDCSSRLAEARFLEGDQMFTPVAPHAALDLLLAQFGALAGRKILLFGAEDPFVRALRFLLEQCGASAEVVSSDLASNAVLSGADALVITEALPSAEMLEALGRLPVLLDAGYYLPPRPVDWIPASVRARIGVQLTQYGNVGPLTVAHLAIETLRAARHT